MKKLTIEFIREQFEKEGYILLSKEYIGAYQKLDYICPKGHKHNIQWSSWQQGRRCGYCVNNIKLVIDFIREQFKKEKYELLTKVYKNNRQKLKCICPNHHKCSITWDCWQQGMRCVYCSNKIRGKKRMLSYSFVKSQFEKRNYKLLSTTYISSSVKLNYICPVGHYGSISWNSFSQGHDCFICKNINFCNEDNPNWKGGISCEPYCQIWLDKEFKNSIKTRDGYICQNPKCWNITKRLAVHHIDYNKKNCNPNNLITTCNSCNSRANFNRDHWVKVYRAIMTEKYGYIYE